MERGNVVVEPERQVGALIQAVPLDAEGRTSCYNTIYPGQSGWHQFTTQMRNFRHCTGHSMVYARIFTSRYRLSLMLINYQPNQLGLVVSRSKGGLLIFG